MTESSNRDVFHFWLSALTLCLMNISATMAKKTSIFASIMSVSVMNICSFLNNEDTFFSAMNRQTNTQPHTHPPKTPIKQSVVTDFAEIHFCEARKVLPSDLCLKQMKDVTDLCMKDAGDQ